MRKVPMEIPSYGPDERLIKLCDDLKNNNLTDIVIVNDGSNEKYNYIFEKIEKNYKFRVKVYNSAGFKTEDTIGCWHKKI